MTATEVLRDALEADRIQRARQLDLAERWGHLNLALIAENAGALRTGRMMRTIDRADVAAVVDPAD